MDKFAIFILSHGRPNEQLTYDALRRSGYTGDIRILCDDMDDTIDEYRKNFGDEVLVFNKAEWSDKSDRITNEDAHKVVLPARNAVTGIAKDLGYTHYMQIDDDFSRIVHRYVDDEGKLRTQEVSDMDGVLKALLEFTILQNVRALGMAHPVYFHYGKEGRFKEGLIPNPYGNYIMSVDEPITFRGLMSEDYVAIADNLQLGQLTYAFTGIMYETADRGSNAGGLNKVYESTGNWMTNIYGLIAHPGKVDMLVQESGKVRIVVDKKGQVPMILSERWRK